MFCDCGNLPSPVNIPQSHFNQDLKRESQKFKVWVILLLHEVQRRGGSCPELSCLRSEEILSIATFITSELINHGVFCIHVFFHKETCLEICVAVVMSLSELLSLFYSRLHLYTSFFFLSWFYIHLLIGYDWLFFFCCMSVIHVTLSLVTKIWSSESGSSITSVSSSLFSFCCFVFKAVSAAVVVDAYTNSTCWTNNIERIFVSSLRN